jgi:hypothetical protein
MKRSVLIVASVFILFFQGLSQVKEKEDSRILFRGQIIDASDFTPVPNSQILINNTFSSVSGVNGNFSFYVNRRDTVVFKSLGYKPSVMQISDTLAGSEYVTGIYMSSDTLSIGEVIIVPGYINLKSEIMNSKSRTPTTLDNARYNVAVSAYQGKYSQSILGNPDENYNVISHRQKVDAFEKGGIPSEHIAGINPLILIPAAYILLHGLPESAPPMSPQVTDEEMQQIHKKYLETHKLKP